MTATITAHLVNDNPAFARVSQALPNQRHDFAIAIAEATTKTGLSARMAQDARVLVESALSDFVLECRSRVVRIRRRCLQTSNITAAFQITLLNRQVTNQLDFLLKLCAAQLVDFRRPAQHARNSPESRKETAPPAICMHASDFGCMIEQHGTKHTDDKRETIVRTLEVTSLHDFRSMQREFAQSSNIE